GGRDIDFFICEDVDTLLYVINLGTIPLHLWASRMARPQHPDWSIIDLDPKTAPFADVVTLANAVHELCEEIGLPSFCKTSGQKGLHVLVPVGGQLTHAQSTTLAELIARAVEARHPKIATTERHIPSRTGRGACTLAPAARAPACGIHFSSRWLGRSPARAWRRSGTNFPIWSKGRSASTRRRCCTRASAKRWLPPRRNGCRSSPAASRW